MSQNDYFAKKIKPDDIRLGHSRCRSDDDGAMMRNPPRDYVFEFDTGRIAAADFGGKITTYRRLWEALRNFAIFE